MAQESLSLSLYSSVEQYQAAPFLIDWRLIKDLFSFFAEHVWEVNVIRRGLGESYGIIGPYRLCITDTTLSLMRVGSQTMSNGESRVASVEFPLAHMRR